MELTKFGHACVAVRKDGGRLVVDPGGLTDPSAVDGADAILITHEHSDHFAEDTVRAAVAADSGLNVWTNSAVALRLSDLGRRVHTVGDGEVFRVAGFTVSVHGTWHAQIHPDIPRIGNIGFRIDDRLFHPGDALTVPEVAVETLLLPVHGMWTRPGELVDYIRAVAPERVFAVHDGLLNDAGLGAVASLLGDGGPATGVPYARLAPGASVDLDPPSGGATAAGPPHDDGAEAEPARDDHDERQDQEAQQEQKPAKPPERPGEPDESEEPGRKTPWYLR
ncbi:MBL fold metallo-hydrolase [Allonocardiopsis opalescens]|uniref:L-ascorbate metabolism protein UlaG (Beta-lactamase superfamily) n=1 Tax=Allonocardiopsis opalescens TaxID=1144618 RepID=A0A2T0Q517_9ACTN|nr:MBL fold metallo-hydrolase [Allonocardiopsis opalescens]PRX98907.1 L-ascorbate metabolism protein UlaG (beta-lactamase superfamily) [Allonocardiopsis opalescens]